MMVTRLVEWIELQLILGVDKIFFHHTAVAPEILDMLLYYQERGKIEAREYVWAGPYSRCMRGSANALTRKLVPSQESHLRPHTLSNAN